MLTLTSARFTLAELRSQHAAGMGQVQLLTSQRNSRALDLDVYRADILRGQLVRALFSKVSEYARQQLKVRIEETVTAALQAVFNEDGLRFEIEIRDVGGKPSAEWSVVSRYVSVGGTGSAEAPTVTEIANSPEDSRGGGIVDVVSLALRLALLELARPKPEGPVILDEPAKMVSAEYAGNLAVFLKSYAARTGRQIIMVTHNETLADAGDVSYRVSKGSNGVSEVKPA